MSLPKITVTSSQFGEQIIVPPCYLSPEEVDALIFDLQAAKCLAWNLGYERRRQLGHLETATTWEIDG